MEVADLKKLLNVAKGDPVKCAAGVAKDGSAHLILHRTKAGPALLKELEAEVGKLAAPCFGMASVNPDDDPKLVILTVNRASGGIGKKLKKSLKGTGFSKVTVRLEDGTEVEAAGEEDEEEGAPPSVAAAPADDTAKVMAGLTAEVPGLIRQVQAAIAADPSRAAAFKTLAATAVASTKGQDVAAATAAMAALKEELAHAPDTAKAGGAALDAKSLQTEFAGLVPKIQAASRDAPEAAGDLRGVAGRVAASLKSGDLVAAKTAMDELKALLEAGGGLDKAANAGGAAPIEIWRDAKETVDKRIGALQTALRQYPNPALREMLSEVADKGLNGVTETASVGMMTAMMQAESSAKARGDAMAAVQKFRAFLASPIARRIDDNPLRIQVNLVRDYGAALDRIEARLAA